MDLFENNEATSPAADSGAPLAARMRPDTLGDIVGQDHILGPGKLLRRAIEADRLGSILLYGPPGCGKTSLAEVIAKVTCRAFERTSGVLANVAILRSLLASAQQRKRFRGTDTILFIDEIHRFNKAQQDVLLSAVEQGTIIFIGATTENPFFYLTGPLLSRTKLFVFEPLQKEDILGLLKAALAEPGRGLGKLQIEIDREALDYLADKANGDARVALNALEMAVLVGEEENSAIKVTLEVAAEAMQKRLLSYDRQGDSHYDMASALIKSIRGSDPDAALYWMARMLKGGEDPTFIARRLMISASEDIGNADPHALTLAVSAANAVQMIGMPEARIPLAQAATYLAAAPKSNASYLAINKAMQLIEEEENRPVPAHLKDSSYRGAKQLGHGSGYRYPHDFPGHYIEQDYLPEEIRDKQFYRPTDQGREKQIRSYLEKIRPNK